mmetsp:Transcript_16434/g.34064  ORF Transcript_16434/g.34064 Transcript_16434/m.34064 type:complete len:130 (+) Transcript_16434:428-817(+)
MSVYENPNFNGNCMAPTMTRKANPMTLALETLVMYVLINGIQNKKYPGRCFANVTQLQSSAKNSSTAETSPLGKRPCRFVTAKMMCPQACPMAPNKAHWVRSLAFDIKSCVSGKEDRRRNPRRDARIMK